MTLKALIDDLFPHKAAIKGYNREQLREWCKENCVYDYDVTNLYDTADGYHAFVGTLIRFEDHSDWFAACIHFDGELYDK